MAQIVNRINLGATGFPFLSELSGRSIIVKQSDQNYAPQIVSKEDQDKDVGIPQLYYCHNVIATSQGYQAVSYLPLIASLGLFNFAGIFPVIDSTNSGKAYVGYTATGDMYYCLAPYYNWTSMTALPATAGKQVTTAYINGITYMYFSTVGCYKFDFATKNLVGVTLTALIPAQVLGIVAVQGYLLAWSAASIAWSSLIDPTDFTPSLVTGAGGGAVQGARGDIVACVSHTIGLVIYTNQNAVAAPASGNARYPFNFRELVASGGLASLDLVTWDANSGNHYVYTSSGLQLISLQQTQTVFPELTDFLAGSVFEDFDEVTGVFSTIALTATMKKKLKLVSDRYLCMSYGVTSLTHVLIYDISLKRWSKFKHDHIDVFEFSLLQAELVETPRRSIALLDKDGSVVVVKIDSLDLTSKGVVLLGKFQYVRSRVTTLDTVEIENIPVEGEVTVTDRYTLDGKALLSKDCVPFPSSGLCRKYGVNVTGVNHSLLLQGNFNLVSILVAIHIHGRR
jgi:hypothetical protein